LIAVESNPILCTSKPKEACYLIITVYWLGLSLASFAIKMNTKDFLSLHTTSMPPRNFQDAALIFWHLVTIPP
jgi:hypothetical protein